MEEIDDVLTELENKLDRLAATRPGMQTTGDIIDSFTRQNAKIKKNRADRQELSKLNSKINGRVNELLATRNQKMEKLNAIAKKYKQAILLVKALDESTKNECDQIAAGSVSKESKKKIATYNKILLERSEKLKKIIDTHNQIWSELSDEDKAVIQEVFEYANLQPELDD